MATPKGASLLYEVRFLNLDGLVAGTNGARYVFVQRSFREKFFEGRIERILRLRRNRRLGDLIDHCQARACNNGKGRKN